MDGKVVLVTGASQGLGKALALAYAGEGAKVVVNSRSEDSISPVAEELENGGAEVLAVAADVSDGGDARRLVEAAVEEFGGIDVLVNNAGVLGPRVAIEEFP
ncbi:MAG: SDR family NAD(P)-dependent oxidoreductase, partial [Rubrobacteraceae bacterium]